MCPSTSKKGRYTFLIFLFLLTDKDVLGLQIAVDDVFGVEVSEGAYDFGGVEASSVFVKTTLVS